MNTPNIRFKGFAGDWEQRKLGDVLKFQNGFNGGREAYGEGTAFISVMDILNNQFITYDCIRGKATVTDEELERFSVRYGDVLFQRSSENVEDAGTSNVYVDTENTAIFGGFVIRGRQIATYSPRFMKYLLDTKAVRGQITKKAQGAQHVNVSQETLQDVQISLPSQEEQEAIESCMCNLDSLIAFHLRKCEDLQEVKKYMLQKMFPKNGAKTPELRFEGFTGDWEQRKFGSLLNEKREKTSVEDEDTLLSCAIDGMYLNSELFSHFRGQSNIGYLKIKKNDLILSAQNLHLGNCNVNLRFEHGIISPAYKVYELVDSNPLFMQAWVKMDKTKEFFLKASTEGASVCRKNIVWEELYKQELPIPSFEEQTKIGGYFANLDNLITRHQRKSDDLKEVKKFMLQNLFPQSK